MMDNSNSLSIARADFFECFWLVFERGGAESRQANHWRIDHGELKSWSTYAKRTA